MPTFYEFFAGGGMARAGLGPKWTCLFANDFDPDKEAIYRSNWAGAPEFKSGDIAKVAPTDLPSFADLSWASFPCQDLSLAGDYAGLRGERSGTFWAYWRLIRELRKANRHPSVIVLENVYGTLTSHGGRDFQAIANAIAAEDYRFGALVLDAELWVPQSRPRLFIVGVRKDISIPSALEAQPSTIWHPTALLKSHSKLKGVAKESWIWWNLPMPPQRNIGLRDIVEENPIGVRWDAQEKTNHILGLMDERHREKVDLARKLSRQELKVQVGTIYRRTREGVQRAEVRFDDIAGCLRTPTGGSSRQTLIFVKNGKVKTRLLSPREAARLMGLHEDYALPKAYNKAYHLLGDGLVVPCVAYLRTHILDRLPLSNNISVVAAE
jgi:DNA (cytosine-5)-methyltransferase 1